MKTGHRILWTCGTSAYRLLLVRGNASDSWRSYVYSEETGAVVFSGTRETGIFTAERRAQLAALRAGLCPVLCDWQEFAA